MKLSLVAPVSMLRDYCITKTQYVLPYLFSENKEYRDFYTECAEAGHTIIVDPRDYITWKRLPPKNYSQVEDCIKTLKPRYIITPSTTFKSTQSLELAKWFLDQSYIKESEGQVVGCIEGTSKEECISHKEGLKSLGIMAYAYPSYILNTYKGSRGIYLENHSRLDELSNCKGILVTSLPIRLGLDGRLIPAYSPTPPSINFLQDKSSNIYPEIVKRNIKAAVVFCKSQGAQEFSSEYD